MSSGPVPQALSETELRSLTGNAMHLAVVGVVIAFATCSLQQSPAEGLSSWHMSSLLVEPMEVEQGEHELA